MKKLKYLLFALILPVMFVFSACGGDQLSVKAQANIGNPENYTEATADDRTAFTTLLNSEESTNVTAYRITMDYSYNTSYGVMETSYNSIIKLTSTSLEIAAKLTQTTMGETLSAKVYLKDGWLYLEGNEAMAESYGSAKVKAEVPEGTQLEDINMLEVLATFSLENVLDMVKAINFDDVAFKVNVEGDLKRYEIVDETMKMYLVFENSTLNAYQVETNINGAIKVVVEAFEGDIEYPNLEGFEETTASIV